MFSIIVLKIITKTKSFIKNYHLYINEITIVDCVTFTARVLLDEYGWKGANWIISGMILNGVCCGLIFRPLVAKREKKRPEADPGKIDHGTIINRIIAEKERQRTTSTGSLNNTIITNQNELIKDQETVKQIMLKYDNQFPKPSITGSGGSIPDIHKESSKLTVRMSSVDEDPDFVTKSQSSLSDCTTQTPNNTPTTEKPINWNIEKLKLGAINKPKVRTISENSDKGQLLQRQLSGSNGHIQSRENLRKRKEDVARPLYRADIFYSGSVTSIPEYTANPNMDSYVASVTSIPDVPQDENSLKAKCLPLCSVLTQMLDFSLLKSMTFVILCTTSVLAMTGQ